MIAVVVSVTVVSGHRVSVRAGVRAQLTDQQDGRQKAALSVALAYAKVDKARERLVAVEQETGTALAVATEAVPLGDLAALAGVPVAELRRLSRGRQDTPTDTPAGDLVDPPVDAPPASTGQAARGVVEPVAVAS